MLLTDARTYDGIYTHEVYQEAAVTYQAATPIFLTGGRAFIRERVISIVASSSLIPLVAGGADLYLTLFDFNGVQRLTDFPLVALWDGFNPAGITYDGNFRPLIFDIDGVSLAKSYVRSPFTTPVTARYVMARLHFHTV